MITFHKNWMLSLKFGDCGGYNNQEIKFMTVNLMKDDYLTQCFRN